MNKKIKNLDLNLIDLVAILIGSLIFSWSLINVNIPNHLADGGISGIALIFEALFKINPAITVIVINIPLLLIGYRLLGLKSLVYTIWGIAVFSGGLWFWGNFHLAPDLHQDKFISATLAGIIGGVGSGIIYRFGGTTGGTDVVARVLENRFNIPMGRSLFVLDIIVLTFSLVYINLVQMMYTLLYSFVFMILVNFIQEGGYSAKVFMIFSSEPELMVEAIMNDLGRGATIINAVGGYTRKEQNIVYVVVSPSEMNSMRSIIKKIDRKAFVSIYNAQEQLGEGFTFDRPHYSIFKRDI